jgi:hypothetical protein
VRGNELRSGGHLAPSRRHVHDVEPRVVPAVATDRVARCGNLRELPISQVQRSRKVVLRAKPLADQRAEHRPDKAGEITLQRTLPGIGRVVRVTALGEAPPDRGVDLRPVVGAGRSRQPIGDGLAKVRRAHHPEEDVQLVPKREAIPRLSRQGEEDGRDLARHERRQDRSVVVPEAVVERQEHGIAG